MSTNFAVAVTTLLCAGLATGCTSRTATVAHTDCVPNLRAGYEMREINRDGVREVFEGDSWGPSGSGPSYPLANCTTDAFLCVKKGQEGAVFAVPRGELPPGAAFEIAGSRVTYLGCYSDGGTACDRRVFVAYWGSPSVEAIRQAMRRPDGSLPSVEETRSRQTYVVDTLLGVVSYLDMPRGMPSQIFTAQAWERFDFNDSGFLLLKSEQGLLACAKKQSSLP